MKYINQDITIPKTQREIINEKILYLIENGLAEQQGITREDIFNSYTGIGGLHGLTYSDYENFYQYSEAKKQVEQGQFFTPHNICDFIVNCIRPANHDIVMDLTSGSGNFFNSLPEKSNVYGSEIDIKAHKVAKYLYPSANLTHGDIRGYKPNIKADIILGNPPFNLNFYMNGEEILSQMYYCQKAAELLKPGGMLVLIVPDSFLSDLFFNKSDIEQIEDNYNFICQFTLPHDAFKNIGVTNFQTKAMFFQRKSKYLKNIPYSLNKLYVARIDNDIAHQLYEDLIKPCLDKKEEVKNKMFFETVKEKDLDKNFTDKVKKLLYDIRCNSKINMYYGKCENYVSQYLTQKKPENMDWKEWEKSKITSKEVFNYLKNILRLQSKPLRNEILLVKNKYGFWVKDYNILDSERNRQNYQSINNLVLEGRTITGYERLLRRKTKAFINQSIPFHDMGIDEKIKTYFDNWSLTNSATGEIIKLKSLQAQDTNKILQKPYGLLQWEQGSGKTISGIAQMMFRMDNNNIHNFFVVSVAISINNTWADMLPLYGINYLRINKLSDIEKIQRGQVVLITLDMVIKYQRQIKKYIKKQSQKIMLIFDESDAISNPYSKRTKAMLSVFRKAQYKLLTTGTTTRNNIAEIAPQLELLYNNSLNMLSECDYVIKTDRDNNQKEIANKYYLQPIPPYRAGYELFSQSHLPNKITVFGIEQKTQDIINSEILKKMLDKTVITRTFREVTGKDIYEIIQSPVSFAKIEKSLYLKAIKEFDEMRRRYFAVNPDNRKDNMFKILQQLLLLLKICANPANLSDYKSNERPSKINKIIDMLTDWNEERVAIGVRHIPIVRSYAKYIQKAFPNRPVFVITGGNTTLNKRKFIIENLKETHNGILLCTQQSLSCSMNIDFVDKVIIPELHYNNASMSQFYFRFIRFTSTKYKEIHFVIYENTIESNLLKMVLVKEKLNLFMKNQILDDDELYERFGVDPGIISNLMSKGYDEDGRVYIRWGEQKIV